MKNLLPTLTLAACTQVRSNLPDTTEARCDKEIQQVIEACEASSVIGSNENPQLDKAVLEAKECFNSAVTVVCSDPGIGEPMIVRFNQM